MKNVRFVPLGLLVVVLSGAAAWHVVQTHGHQASRVASQKQSAGRQADLSPQSAPQTLNAQQQNPSPAPYKAAGAAPAGAAQEEEAELRLGPFSISGSDYTVVLRERNCVPGSTAPHNDLGLSVSVVAMEIRDATGAVLYHRTFPYHAGDGTWVEAWGVSAKILDGTNGTGLLVQYSFDSEPSAPQEEYPDWWQVFGVVGGKLRPFGAPIYSELLGWDDTGKPNIYKPAEQLGPRADALQFRVWTGHFRMIFPVRLDWGEGKLTPAQPCEQPATASSSETQGCQYKVLPEDDRRVGDMTFVSLCPSPDAKCEKPEKVVVKRDSKVDLLVAQVRVEWSGGAVSGPSGKSAQITDAMDDAGGVALNPSDELWLKVRIDGKEGWMHGEEDFNALGLPRDM